MMHIADRDALGADVALRERIVFVATNRNNTIAIELELQPAHCLAECASPENCAQSGHGVTRDPAAKSNLDETLKKEHETFYRAGNVPWARRHIQPSSHDDLINAAAGALVLASGVGSVESASLAREDRGGSI